MPIVGMKAALNRYNTMTTIIIISNSFSSSTKVGELEVQLISMVRLRSPGVSVVVPLPKTTRTRHTLLGRSKTSNSSSGLHEIVVPTTQQEEEEVQAVTTLDKSLKLPGVT